MKINLAWLADFVDLQLDQAELLNRINTQLGEIESIVDLGQKYKDALIVKVAKVESHPQADKLSVCLIDDNQICKTAKRQQGYVQLVCGASNVKAGMLAVWLPPQACVPATYASGAEIKLDAREIRGVLSYGMLASAFELDIGSESDEILEVKAMNSDLPLGYPRIVANDDLIGRSFALTFNLQTTVVDIENKMFTHRPDCFGLLGVAREIAAITKSRFKRPSWYISAEDLSSSQSDTSLEIDVRCPELVPRFRATIIRDLKNVGPSDLLMRSRLASVGFKPVNSVVDATNYVMYVSGQPTHAFDYDKFLDLSSNKSGSPGLVVRQSEKGEELRLLNGKTVTFDQPAIVIATDKCPVALGGIMGGVETEVDAGTKNILLECANFDMYNLRRTTMHYGIFSEAATRFTKGQSLAQIPAVTKRTSALIAGFANGQSDSPVCEFLSKDSRSQNKPLLTTAIFISSRLGLQLSAEAISDLLKAVEFEVKIDGEQLQIESPFWRTDIEIAEDIVEEVGRLIGYMTLTPVLPVRSVKPAGKDELLGLRAKIRRYLAARGASEAMSYSFVSTDLFNRSGQDPDNAFHLSNPLNPSLEAYRQSLTPSLLDLVEGNRRLGYKDFALFEVGCVHQKNQEEIDMDGLPLDLQRVAFVCHRAEPRLGSPFYTARRHLDLIASSLNLELLYKPYPQLKPSEVPAMSRVYDLKNSAQVEVGGLDLGIVGLLNQNGTYAGWEIKTDVLLKAQAKAETNNYRALARYPKSSQDLTLKAPLKTAYGELRATLTDVLTAYHQNGWQTDLKLLNIFYAKKDSAVKNISFRLLAWHQEKTVQKEEVSEMVSALVAAARLKHQADQVV